VDFRAYDTRLAAYALLTDAHARVLLALWNEGPEPLWTLPGGGVDLDETVYEAAVREVREETGYQIALQGVLGVDSFVIPAAEQPDGVARPFKSVRVVFGARIVGGQLENELEGTTDEARWVPLAEVTGLPRVPLVDAALAMRSASALTRQ
jgi:8-oxo-dGTP diphosphatase